MTRARAVIGSSFGDEGKGLVTDYLCATAGAGVVVRFNGGAQAGHTVVTPEGKRHVFHHFGSGTMWGAPTFLSQFFICNPIVCLAEADELIDLGIKPILYAHPNCIVTTFADMIINQRKEKKRGDKRHGSVGVGIHETIQRSHVPGLKITMSDLWNNVSLEKRLYEICGKYAEFRTGSPIEHPDVMIAQFIKHCETFANAVHPAGIEQCSNIIFEGAQGLLLDQDNEVYRPYLTHSNTGMKNVRILCQQAGIDDVDIYYVSRTYLTRHGAGPLPGEDPHLKYHDDTNVTHEFQGKLRFAPLDPRSLVERCEEDCKGADYKLVLTHCDQVKPPMAADLYSYGPTRADFTEDYKTAALRC